QEGSADPSAISPSSDLAAGCARFVSALVTQATAAESRQRCAIGSAASGGYAALTAERRSRPAPEGSRLCAAPIDSRWNERGLLSCGARAQIRSWRHRGSRVFRTLDQIELLGRQ